jgi:hypothetical protein
MKPKRIADADRFLADAETIHSNHHRLQRGLRVLRSLPGHAAPSRCATTGDHRSHRQGSTVDISEQFSAAPHGSARIRDLGATVRVTA